MHRIIMHLKMYLLNLVTILLLLLTQLSLSHESIDKYSVESPVINSYEDLNIISAKNIQNTGQSLPKVPLKKIHIGGLFPMNGTTGWVGGQGCLPAAQMALQDVNRDPNLLIGYELDLKWNNSQVCFIYIQFI